MAMDNIQHITSYGSIADAESGNILNDDTELHGQSLHSLRKFCIALCHALVIRPLFAGHYEATLFTNEEVANDNHALPIDPHTADPDNDENSNNDHALSVDSHTVVNDNENCGSLSAWADGRYSSAVFLMVGIAIILALLSTETIKPATDELKDIANIVQILMIWLLLIACICQIFVYLSCLNYRTEKEKSSVQNIKLFFFFGFSSGYVIRNIVNAIFEINCSIPNRLENVLSSVRLIILSMFVIFQPLLFWNIRYKNVTKTPACLFSIILFVITNVSNFVYHSIQFHFDDIGDDIHFQNCQNVTTAYQWYEKHIKPVFDPMVFETSVLAIILLAEVVGNSHSSASEDVSFINNDTEGVGNSNFNASIDVSSLNNHAEVENDSFAKEVYSASESSLIDNRNGSSRIQAGEETTCLNRKTKIKCGLCLIVGVLFSPMFVVKAFQIKGNDADIHYTFSVSSYSLVKIVVYVIFGLCMHYLKGQKKKDIAPSLTPFDYILLLCTLGSSMYFTFQLIASIAVVDKRWQILKNILNIFTTFTQTVLILQMKSFNPKASNRMSRRFSNCLFTLSMLSLFLWFFDTFLEAQFAYKNDYTLQYFGTEYFLSVRHLLLPIIIFYRFECFLAFLKLSIVF